MNVSPAATGEVVGTAWKSRFYVIWSGQALSLFGSALVKFALIWWLALETGKATTLGIATVLSFAPAFVIGPFAGGVIELGVFQAIYAGFGILAAIVLSAWGGFKRKIYTSLLGTSIGLLGFLIILCSPSNRFAFALIGIGVFGFALPIHGSPITAIYQTIIPKEKQARAFSINQAMLYASMPLGMAIFTPLADRAGILSAYYIGVFGLGLLIVMRLRIPSIRTIDSAQSGESIDTKTGK